MCKRFWPLTMISYQLVSMYLFVLLTSLECTLVLCSSEEQSTLDSHVYKTLSVNKDQCELICMEDPRCASYNYKLDKNAKEYCKLNVCGMEEQHDISAALRKYRRPSGSFIVSQTHQVRPVKNREQCRLKLACPFGYYGDGLTCKDIEECRDGTHNCSKNANCTNTEGSFNCTCLEGYIGDGVMCKDMDECRDGTHNCSLNANCTNTDGSFNCTCLEGYIGDGVTCKACQSGWKHFNGSCYKYFDDKKSWDEAKTKCESYHASLPSVHSSKENSFIRLTLSNMSAWIGLNDKTAEGNFTWVDGTPLDYTNWNVGEPNDVGGEDCVEVIVGVHVPKNGVWNDDGCHELKHFVCTTPL